MVFVKITLDFGMIWAVVKKGAGLEVNRRFTNRFIEIL